MTSVYFISFACSRLATVFLVVKAAPALLVGANLSVLLCGSLVLLFLSDNFIAFYCGVVCIGVGLSTLFTSGLLWLRERLEMGAGLTSLFLIATSVGAQCFKIPVAFYIETNVAALLYAVATGAFACAVLFATAKCIAGCFLSERNT